MAIELILAGLKFATQLARQIPKIREAATTEDKAKLDVLYAEFQAASNEVADKLRAIPDDPS
jgi:hypothetical protein